MPLNRCTYIMVKGPNKGLMCGHGCKGTLCNRHTPEFLEKCRKRQQEVYGTYRAGLQRKHWEEVAEKLKQAATAEQPLAFVSQPPPETTATPPSTPVTNEESHEAT